MFFIILFSLIISFLSTVTLFIMGISHYAIVSLVVFVLSLIFLIIYYIKNKKEYKRHKENIQEGCCDCSTDAACIACSPKCDFDCSP